MRKQKLKTIRIEFLGEPVVCPEFLPRFEDGIGLVTTMVCKRQVLFNDTIYPKFLDIVYFIRGNRCFFSSLTIGSNITAEITLHIMISIAGREGRSDIEYYSIVTRLMDESISSGQFKFVRFFSNTNIRCVSENCLADIFWLFRGFIGSPRLVFSLN